MPAVAIIGAAVIGAAGTVIAGQSAANATRDATNAAIAEQNKVLGEQATLSAPYRALGQSALPQYEALLGLGPQGARGIQGALEATPGYQFTKKEGLTGITNLASTEGGLSGNTLAAAETFASGLADQTYEQRIGDIYGAVGLGQAAAAGQATNIGRAGENISSALIGQGSNLAGIYAGEAAGIGRAIGGAESSWMEYQQLQKEQDLIAALTGGGGGGTTARDVTIGGYG